ncbi:MAG: hypothetical protein HFG77_08350 [Hungatella sp.]|nr:hypothetical protein [Hungatella sp.]
MKSKKVYGLVGVAALAAVGGTFAYYNATQTFNNQFDTSKYGTYAVEQFNPADGHNWEPGAEVDKKVYATNTGDADVWVRIKLDETWSGLNSDVSTKTINAETVYNKNPENGISAGNNQADKANGEVNADGASVVYKKFVDTISADRVEEGTKWFYEGGWFYYTTALVPDASTDGLLESVTLCGDTDMGLFENKNYYKVAPSGLTGTDLLPFANGELQDDWVEFTTMILDDNNQNVIDDKVITIDKAKDETLYTYKSNALVDKKHGYANANYQLDITVQFVQTTKAAATEAGWSEAVVNKLFPEAE